MGKIKKIKQDRKRAEVEVQLGKMKRNRLIIQLGLLFLLGFLLTSAGIIGYKAADERYALGSKVSSLWSKTKDTTESKETSLETAKTITYKEAPKMQIDTNKTYIAKFETSQGNFDIELYAKKAPKTVNNFVVLSKDGFYNNLTFHRVIKDFMIQGGDPKGDGTGGPGYKFEDEINDIKLVQGVLAMANSGPDTNGSQFFVVTKEATDWLDGKHTAFGKVTSGLDVVMKIDKVEVGENDKPKDPVVIKRVTIEEK